MANPIERPAQKIVGGLSCFDRGASGTLAPSLHRLGPLFDLGDMKTT